MLDPDRLLMIAAEAAVLRDKIDDPMPLFDTADELVVHLDEQSAEDRQRSRAIGLAALCVAEAVVLLRQAAGRPSEYARQLIGDVR